MIINETYDKSLWLMLCSDKINRERIVEFINKVPLELYTKIGYSLDVYVHSEDKWVNKNNQILSGDVKTSGDMRYWYMFEPKTCALNLGETVVDGEFEYDTFHMTLYPVDEKILNNNRSYSDSLIGRVTNGYLDDYSLSKLNETINFHLIRFSFCDVIVSCSKDFIYNKNKYCFVNLSKIPNNYDFSSLSSKDSIKKLVRGKKILGN